MPTPRAKRPKFATEIRQASLLEAALQLAATHSPLRVTTSDLARAVGLTQGAVFRHFASKDAIWVAAIDWAKNTLMAQLHAAATQQHPLEALQAVFKAHVDFVIAYPGVPRIIFQELQHPCESPIKACVRDLMAQYRALLMKLLSRAKDLALIAPEVDLSAASVLFIGSIQGLVMQSLLSGSMDTITVEAPGVFSIYLSGLTAKKVP
jgi:AcrR family transcriptional regulator